MIKNNPSAIIVDNMVKKFPPDAKLNIAFLGYHDVMLTSREWNALLGDRINLLEVRPNSANLIQVHSRQHDVEFCPTIKSWLNAAYGERVSYTVFDIDKYEGEEVEWDFNESIPIKFWDTFDIIVDIGTCEHIFNIGQAFSNILHMTKVGGFIMNHGPICQPNHGFYGYNPTLFADFYEANACEIIDMALQTIYPGQPHTILAFEGIPKYGRFTFANAFRDRPDLLQMEYNLITITNKYKEQYKIVYPVQHKYRSKEQWT